MALWVWAAGVAGREVRVYGDRRPVGPCVSLEKILTVHFVVSATLPWCTWTPGRYVGAGSWPLTDPPLSDLVRIHRASSRLFKTQVHFSS